MIDVCIPLLPHTKGVPECSWPFLTTNQWDKFLKKSNSQETAGRLVTSRLEASCGDSDEFDLGLPPAR